MHEQKRIQFLTCTFIFRGMNLVSKNGECKITTAQALNLKVAETKPVFPLSFEHLLFCLPLMLLTDKTR